MGEVALRFIQGGLESSKGTAVNAARILLGEITSTSFETPIEFIEEDRGTLTGNVRYIVGIKDHGFTFETPASYEQIGWHFATCLVGSVAASTVGATGKRYIYTPQTTAGGDNLQAATIEFGDNTQEFEVTYAEGTHWTLGFDTLAVGGTFPVNLSIDYISKAVASNTKTAALTIPTVETIDAALATFALGNTSTAYAALSTLTGSLRSFSLDYDNGLAKKVYVGDGRDLSNMGRGRRKITFDAIFEGDSNGVTRFTEWDTQTEKRIRLKFAGTTISGSSPATAKQLWIDGRVLFTAWELGTVDTNNVFQMHGEFLIDSALSDAEIQVTLTNDVASYA